MPPSSRLMKHHQHFDPSAHWNSPLPAPSPATMTSSLRHCLSARQNCFLPCKCLPFYLKGHSFLSSKIPSFRNKDADVENGLEDLGRGKGKLG